MKESVGIESFPEYLDSIGKKNYAMDIELLIGHGPIRSYVMEWTELVVKKHPMKK